jgi:hypothetical protein
MTAVLICVKKLDLVLTRIASRISAHQGEFNMRWATGIFLLVATTLPSAAQVASEKTKLPDYYPLKVGTKWTYEVDAGTAQKVQVTNQIAKIETIDGKSLARLETVVNGMVAATEHLSSTPQGVFRHRINGVEATPPVCILRYPFKDGEKWEAETTVGPQHLKLASRNGESEEVTSPAGKYKTVSVVTETNVNGAQINNTCWYAPDVGIVKQNTEIAGKNINLMLVKFEPGK